MNLRPIFPLAEALGEISLPLSLEIVGADRSHPEAGSAEGDLIACCLVANDSQILGRLFALLMSNLRVVPESILKVVFVLVINTRNIFENLSYEFQGIAMLGWDCHARV